MVGPRTRGGQWAPPVTGAWGSLVRLDAGEIGQLPLACALVDGEGRLIAASPEWAGPSPGTVSFNTGHAQLLVAVDAASVHLNALMTRLLDELAAAARPRDPAGRQASDDLRV